MIETDYLVIGSGLAGLYFALRASEHGRVVIATKRAPADANTAYAQGGVAGALDPEDRIEDHVEDTLRVGDGLCHRDIVEICAREAPEHILWFANELGVPFDRDRDGHLALGREGGHTARRIVGSKSSLIALCSLRKSSLIVGDRTKARPHSEVARVRPGARGRRTKPRSSSSGPATP